MKDGKSVSSTKSAKEMTQLEGGESVKLSGKGRKREDNCELKTGTFGFMTGVMMSCWV